jgi:hypothetical protein
VKRDTLKKGRLSEVKRRHTTFQKQTYKEIESSKSNIEEVF